MHKVSIIMPYYKKRKYFYNSLKSVLKQSYKNFEIIIIYDDKDLNDYRYIKKITKGYKKIKIILNRSSIGAGYSRNKGIKFAKGFYLAFCDCDDIWDHNKLKKQINFMEKENIPFSYTAYNVINSKGNFLEKKYFKKNADYNSLLKHCYIGLSTVLMERKLIRNNIKFSKLKTKEDFTLWLKLAKKGVAMKGINVELTSWRKTSNSLSSSIMQKISDGYKVYNKELKYNTIMSLFLLFILSVNSFLK